MADRYDVAVVGAGMIGACAAWHIAARGLSVALVGPGEPADKAAHRGVFASHYDEGRITRTLDADPLWARLALASIARYGDLEREGSIAFYHEAGCLRLGLVDDAGIDAADRNGRALGARHQRLAAADLRARLPFLALPDGAEGLLETDRSGHVNPRALVAAACTATERRGGRLVRAEARALEPRPGGCRVTLADGTILDAGRVLVATGAFAHDRAILPRRLDLVVEPRTVVMFECDAAARATLASLPSLISSVGGDGSEIDLYAVPPVAYPDGRIFFKAGSGEFSAPLDTADGIEPVKAWFRGPGRDHEIAYIRKCVEGLLPALRGVPTATGQCAVTISPTNHPYLGLIDDGPVAVALAGNGYAAKSCIEIGRIAGDMIADGGIADEGDVAAFAPRFAD
jgi:glycine/D-amino acid oxidase-like deaminating enzyme